MQRLIVAAERPNYLEGANNAKEIIFTKLGQIKAKLRSWLISGGKLDLILTIVLLLNTI
jgi:hypothetical protein